MRKNHAKKGFTFIELLVVIGIILILAALVFVALNPAKRFKDARNARRVMDVNNILTAVHECIVDNQGDETACGIASLPFDEEIGTTPNFNLATSMAGYLKSNPVDPLDGTAASTKYQLEVDANGLVTVTANSAEDITIEVSR